jgi:hypothetical protein
VRQEWLELDVVKHARTIDADGKYRTTKRKLDAKSVEELDAATKRRLVAKFCPGWL